MTATAEAVSFNIEGAFIANLARDFVMEGRWERGLKLLTDYLHGMNHELAIKILKGEGTLTGWSSDADGIEFKELPANNKIAKGMADQIQFLYGKTFYYGDTYWQPYARVASWGKDDYTFATSEQPKGKVLDETPTRSASAPGNRSLYYANNPAKDMLIIVGVGPRHVEVLRTGCVR